MTILVPVDYSKASKVAALFAAGLAKKLNASLKMVHVVQANPSGETLMKLKKLEDELMKIAHEDGQAFMDEIRKSIRSKKVDVTLDIKAAFDFTKAVNKFAADTDADLIVMGTTGASGLKKVLLGSNAAAMINTATVPVLVVPAQASFSSLKKMVYATNLKHTENEIKTVALFAEQFGARLDVVHIVPKKSPDLPKPEAYAKNLQEITRYKRITFSLMVHANTAQGIDNFVKKQKAQLLVTFTHKLSPFEKLFNKGITRRLVYHTRVPILTFNSSTLL
jgi:nucleotide-binding universal stress UspA family protein